MSWEQVESYFLHHEEKEIFAIILEGEMGCHWAWYVIDDENGTLLGSGSDDELQAAKQNAEKAMGIR